MISSRIIAATCFAAGALLLLSACGGGHSHAASSSVKAATVVAQHNPVDILRKSGCTVPSDEKIGQPTLFNDGGLGYCADGYWGDPNSGERITVWRYPSHAIMLQGNGDGPTRRDGMTFIMSNDDGDWFAEVTAGDNGLASGPTPTTIAQLIGGHIAYQTRPVARDSTRQVPVIGPTARPVRLDLGGFVGRWRGSRSTTQGQPGAAWNDPI